MNARRVLLLPGTANPDGSENYRLAYGLIKGEAENRKCFYDIVCYPGWGTKGSGLLNYHTALAAARQKCRAFGPEWLIGRSLGCDVALGLLSTGESWVKKCKGAALWGASTSEDLQRIWPTAKEKQAEIGSYEKNYKTFVAPDYFESIPPFEERIASAACNLRLARGAEDWDNTPDGLLTLGQIHDQAQPSFRVEVVKAIPGLEHTVTGKESSEAVRAYLDCLFDLFTPKSKSHRPFP